MSSGGGLWCWGLRTYRNGADRVRTGDPLLAKQTGTSGLSSAEGAVPTQNPRVFKGFPGLARSNTGRSRGEREAVFFGVRAPLGAPGGGPRWDAVPLELEVDPEPSDGHQPELHIEPRQYEHDAPSALKNPSRTRAGSSVRPGPRLRDYRPGLVVLPGISSARYASMRGISLTTHFTACWVCWRARSSCSTRPP